MTHRPPPRKQRNRLAAYLGRLAGGLRGGSGDAPDLRAEVADLRSRQERVAEYLALCQAMILDLAPDGRVAAINRRGCEILGMPEDRILGRPWVEDFLPEAVRVGVREAHARLLAGHSATAADQYDVQTAAGACRTVAWQHAVSRDANGRPTALLASGIDVTERCQTECTRPESERMFRNLFEYAGDAIFIADLESGRLLDINEHGARQLGYGREELLGMTVAEITAAGSREKLKQVMRQVRAQGWTLFEQVHRRQDGTLFPVEINARLVEYGGRIVAQGIIRDLTERKLAERSLLEAKAEAERANAAKSKFLAAASHDLRQPVHAIGLFAGSLLKRPLDPETLDIVRQLVASLEAFETLLNSLLHISRLDAGVLVPRRGAFAIGPLLDEIGNEFTPQAADKGIGFRVVPCSLAIDSDRGLLGRILRNLIANAIRHTARGGILIGCRRRAGGLVLQVWDTGEGIPDDQKGAIFREFYQIGNPERDRERGLGLGLAIVDRLTRLLDHPLALNSRLGKGSCFSVTVPLAQGPAEAPPPPELALPTTDSRLDGARVLLIEDDRNVREATLILLDSWGCRTTAAASAEEALALAADWVDPPALVVADYRLPGGWTGVQAIQDLGRRMGMPLKGVVITGDTDPDRIREATQAGFNLAYKPLRPARLRALVTRLLAS
ncbi:MAG: PAS domain S-box protein [Magnetospirillum sp. WYHS-4]